MGQRIPKGLSNVSHSSPKAFSDENNFDKFIIAMYDSEDKTSHVRRFAEKNRKTFLHFLKTLTKASVLLHTAKELLLSEFKDEGFLPEIIKHCGRFQGILFYRRLHPETSLREAKEHVDSLFSNALQQS